MRKTSMRMPKTKTILVPLFALFLVNDPSRHPVAGPIPDKNLEAAVRAALHLDEKAELGDEKLKNLYTLEASNKEIRDLTGLEKCPNLASLRLDKGQVADLTPLKDLANLQSLDLAANKVTDLTPLAGLAKLQYLNLADNQVAKLDPLAGLTALSALYLSGNQVADLSPLGNIPRLASLYLARNQITDIGPLTKQSRLVTLNVSDNQIADIGPLTKLEDLNLAILERNKVADLTPLVEAWKSGKGESKRAFLRLYLAGNPLSDAAKGEQVGRSGGGREDRILTRRPVLKTRGKGQTRSGVGRRGASPACPRTRVSSRGFGRRVV